MASHLWLNRYYLGDVRCSLYSGRSVYFARFLYHLQCLAQRWRNLDSKQVGRFRYSHATKTDYSVLLCGAVVFFFFLSKILSASIQSSQFMQDSVFLAFVFSFLPELFTVPCSCRTSVELLYRTRFPSECWLPLVNMCVKHSLDEQKALLSVSLCRSFVWSMKFKLLLLPYELLVLVGACSVAIVSFFSTMPF